MLQILFRQLQVLKIENILHLNQKEILRKMNKVNNAILSALILKRLGIDLIIKLNAHLVHIKHHWKQDFSRHMSIKQMIISKP